MLIMRNSILMERDIEITDLFLSLLGCGKRVEEIKAMCADMPCSRFWIEPETAMRLIKGRLAGGRTQPAQGKRHSVKINNNILRIDEIIKLCKGDFSFDNVLRVVTSPAPRFFISRRTAQAIISRTLKKRRNGKITLDS